MNPAYEISENWPSSRCSSPARVRIPSLAGVSLATCRVPCNRLLQGARRALRPPKRSQFDDRAVRPLPRRRDSQQAARPSGASSDTTSSSASTAPMTDREIAASLRVPRTKGEIGNGRARDQECAERTGQELRLDDDHRSRPSRCKGQVHCKRPTSRRRRTTSPKQLKTETETTIASLMKAQKGKELRQGGRTWTPRVKAHLKVLSMIDDKLMPNAKNPELRTHLHETRASVRRHHLAESSGDRSEALERGSSYALAFFHRVVYCHPRCDGKSIASRAFRVARTLLASPSSRCTGRRRNF